jgi:hypothetical protein
MILLDKPYVSDFLKRTIAAEGLPVLRTEGLERFTLDEEAVVYEQEAALRGFLEAGPGLLLSNSENGLSWMLSHLGFSELPEKITLFKDKVAFRDLLRPLYPDFYYREILLEDLFTLDVGSLPMPFVVKPAVGFFSMGVHKVASGDEWEDVLHVIGGEMDRVKALYPLEVLDTTRFIIETCVEGEEFAIDAYYDGAGNVVLLNVLQHLFSSAEDVSDRVYITSREIVASYKEWFVDFLTEIGNVATLRNFPVHAEVRIDGQGRIWPIEVNPMRFAGWCTTDVAHYAYGINPYTCYFRQAAPDWAEILAEGDKHLYSIVVLDMPADVEASSIRRFDYDLVRSRFEMPLELRRIDYQEYPVFGFLFTKTRKENVAELEGILRSDLKEFIE